MKNLTTYPGAKTYQSGTGITTELLTRFREINEYDRNQMFGFKKESDLFKEVKEGKLTEDEIDMYLTWYEKEYVSPFWNGDILKDNSDDSEWIVTCIYTDGSIDLIPKEGKIQRKNTGTIGTDYEKIGSLEVIIEKNITISSLLREEK